MAPKGTWGSAPKINTYTMRAENHICNNNYIIIFHMITIITDNNVFNYWVQWRSLISNRENAWTIMTYSPIVGSMLKMYCNNCTPLLLCCFQLKAASSHPFTAGATLTIYIEGHGAQLTKVNLWSHSSLLGATQLVKTEIHPSWRSVAVQPSLYRGPWNLSSSHRSRLLFYYCYNRCCCHCQCCCILLFRCCYLHPKYWTSIGQSI